MRLYGKRSIRRGIDRRINRRKEVADGILWSVDWVSNVALVRIQGSNEDIVCHFPRNWKDKPYWLKPRNAVRVIFREGRRGYIEISGEGRAIPTPVSGGAMPPISAEEDGIISGIVMTPTSPESLSLLISDGYYRIDVSTYYLDTDLLGGASIIMDDPAPMIMGDGLIMGTGSVFYTVTLDAAPACYYYRYDGFVVGTDGVIDYLKGTVSAISSEPTKPPVPGDHILIGDYIFVRPNVTSIGHADIGAEWSEEVLSDVQLTGAATLSWSTLITNPQTTISIAAKDQYECNFRVPYGSLTTTVTVVAGTGDVSNDGVTWASSCTFTMGATGSFRYRRDQTEATEVSPLFTVEITYGRQSFTGTYVLTLLDSLGEEIA